MCTVKTLIRLVSLGPNGKAQVVGIVQQLLMCKNEIAPTFGDSSMFPPDGVFLPELVFSFVDDVSIVFCRRGG